MFVVFCHGNIDMLLFDVQQFAVVRKFNYFMLTNGTIGENPGILGINFGNYPECTKCLLLLCLV